MVAPAQHRRQIEAKAIDMHVADPAAQAVHDQLEHPGLADVQRVAAAAVVFKCSGRLGRVAVIAGIVQPAKAHAGAGAVGLGRVVEHHVEQYLDALGMQGFDHGAKFVARIQAVLA